MPYKNVWQAPSCLKLDQTRLKYSAIFRRFQGASSSQATVVKHEQNPIAMWIADIDIPPCEHILSVITHNLRTTYGYQSLYIGDAVAQWYERSLPKNSRFTVEASDIVDVTSVIGAVDVALRTFCRPKQKVMVFTPTYAPLTEAITNNALIPVFIPLKQHTLFEATVPCESASNSASKQLKSVESSNARFDMSALDESAAAFVICHPNNPTGTVLSTEEQIAITDFCARHNILLITDEVHSEFAFNTFNEPTLIPLFGVGALSGNRKDERQPGLHSLPRIIHINSVSKAFNLASVPGASYAIIKDKQTREKFREAINARHLYASNVGKVALIAAYEQGSTWLDDVKSALGFNRKLVSRFFEYYGITATYTMGNAGYFLWLDLQSFPSQIPTSRLQNAVKDKLTQRRLSEKPNKQSTSNQSQLDSQQYSPVKSVEECIERGVIGNDGAPFGAAHHIRLNLACHPAVIESALQRLCFVSCP
ncbi:aminotransferase class I/II-fold pyridoxal phosphate-dependent enzyme [Alteromonas gracilis]|uniref:aminotransferase class I/II-fold pyridoxal phosphate-dependent enzyme n=1 Tax=Alteromonas gracilis TaxID=1479524 RepID=UPI003735E4A1